MSEKNFLIVFKYIHFCEWYKNKIVLTKVNIKIIFIFKLFGALSNIK